MASQAVFTPMVVVPLSLLCRSAPPDDPGPGALDCTPPAPPLPPFATAPLFANVTYVSLPAFPIPPAFPETSPLVFPRPRLPRLPLLPPVPIVTSRLKKSVGTDAMGLRIQKLLADFDLYKSKFHNRLDKQRQINKQNKQVGGKKTKRKRKKKKKRRRTRKR